MHSGIGEIRGSPLRSAWLNLHRHDHLTRPLQNKPDVQKNLMLLVRADEVIEYVAYCYSA